MNNFADSAIWFYTFASYLDCFYHINKNPANTFVAYFIFSRSQKKLFTAGDWDRYLHFTSQRLCEVKPTQHKSVAKRPLLRPPSLVEKSPSLSEETLLSDTWRSVALIVLLYISHCFCMLLRTVFNSTLPYHKLKTDIMLN